jgi:hypothetical protein
VGAGVVEDQVDVQICRDVGIHMAQEAAKLHRAVSTVTFAQHLTRLHGQRGEEGGCAVPPVVMGAALDLPGTHGQQGLGAIQGLDLALLIHAEDEGLVRGIQVEAHDVFWPRRRGFRDYPYAEAARASLVA